MSPDMDGHVEDRIQALLDGELPDAEAAAVKAHCDGCERCGRALTDLRAVRRVLETDRDASLFRPMWPAVRDGLARRSSPRFGVSFGLATSAAAAGVVLGILLGSPREVPRYPSEVSGTYAEGSFLGDDSVPTLDEIYVDSFGEDGDD